MDEQAIELVPALGESKRIGNLLILTANDERHRQRSGRTSATNFPP